MREKGVSQELDMQLLKEVSRSFYLTLRLLPTDTRKVISLGYLLARASDTIADSGDIPLKTRKEHLDQFVQAVSGGEGVDFIHVYAGLKHEGEARLMASLNEIIPVVLSLNAEENAALYSVVKTITEGQLWDVTYFKESLTQVQCADELEHYIYCVAGSVGEFWTKVLAMKGVIKTPDLGKMHEAGIRYGKGLQLTNIIRDIPEDYKNGRVYIPEGGSSLDEIIKESSPWLVKAKEYLESAEHYLTLLPRGRARLATTLPARLAQQTLLKLESSSLEERRGVVKVDRGTVLRELIGSLVR